ncbi:MAG: 23S rRNA (uracil(1939)-C(5))-methyltransferase RlmD [Candidatus Njordarchaeales archaeon]
MGTRKEIVIQDIDEKGFGIGKTLDGAIIRVPYVIPGERVLVKVISRKRGDAILLKVLEESDKRVYPLCPYFGVCGGCFWQHIRYDEQLKLKHRIVERFFDFCLDSIRGIIGADKIWRYRNKMEFAFGRGFIGITIGLRARGRFDKVINIDSCLIQKEEADNVLRIVKKFVNEKNLTSYDPKKHEGFLRYLVIRSSYKTDQLMANIITTSKEEFKIEELAKILEVNSLIWSVSDSVADVAVGEIKAIIGREFIEERILNLFIRIYPYSFFQTNPIQAEKMYKLVKELVDEGNLALDLYAGMGIIGMIISERFEKIIGIEIVKEAIKAGKENLEINEINNVCLLEGKVEEILPSLVNEKIDVVITDPPRAGMHKKAIQALAKIKPQRIVYVSCNPKTQSRDIKYLLKLTNNGYQVSLVQPIDMFPHTPHIENVVALDLR